METHPISLGKATQLAWSPVDEILAASISSLNGNSIVIVRPNGTGRMELIKEGASWPKWSPDGRHIAFSGSHSRKPGLYIMSNFGEATKLLVAQNQVTNISWSPNGQFIAFTAQAPDGGSELKVVDVDWPDALWVPGLKGDFSNLFWSPDSAKLGYSSNGIHMLDVRLGGETFSEGICAAWSINADYAVYNMDKIDIFQYNGENYTLKVDFAGTLQWSLDSNILMFLGKTQRKMGLFVLKKGQMSHPILLESMSNTVVAWPALSHTNKYVAFTHGNSEDLNVYIGNVK